MKLSTPVTDYGKTFLIQPADKILSLGSCFANVVGQRLHNFRVPTLLNPAGTLYNPKSILSLLDLALDYMEFPQKAKDLVCGSLFRNSDGIWHSWLAASQISGQNREECLANINQAVRELADFLNQADVLMITFGTDHYYSLNNGNHIPDCVANCHKMPSSIFREKIMSVSDIVNMFSETYSRIKTLRPELKAILTVSPYRYLKYGLHQNQLSKARLLLAVDECTNRHDDIYYFPAYEILNDELRDYRYYAPDMAHPSEVAEEYVWEMFCRHYIDTRLLSFFKEWSTVLKMQVHRPSSTSAAEELKANIEARIKSIQKKFPQMF